MPAVESELDRVLGEYVAENRPVLPLQEELDRANGATLFWAWANSRCRDLLLHPPPELEKFEARAARFKKDKPHLSLRALFRKKLRTGTSRPACFRVLAAIRQQWHGLLAGLPVESYRRQHHVLQVQLCPDVVSNKLLSKLGLTFSLLKSTVDVGSDPVPLPLVRAQWLTFEFDRLKGRVVTTLREGLMSVDPHTLVPDIKVDNRYDFSYVPQRAGNPDRGILPLEKVVTLENALAIHEAVEAATVSGTGCQHELMYPELWVQGELSHFSYANVRDTLTENFYYEVSEKLHAFNRRADCLPSCEWVEILRRPEVAEQLLVPAYDVDGLAAQLEEAPLEEFLAACWKADQKLVGQKRLFRLDYFSPGSRLNPVRSQRDLYAVFPPALLGRDAFHGGSMHRLPLAAAVQVLEESPA